MNHRISRYIWIIVIILFLFLWVNRHDMPRIFRSNPDPESLDFNQPRDNNRQAPTIISNDEKINIDVFEKVHPAVVNIVATTLSVNFWMGSSPEKDRDPVLS
jgi:hypothetical protein